MSKRWMILVALATTAGVATVVTLSLKDPQARQVITAGAQDADLVEVTTTVPNSPVDTDLNSKLNCAPVPAGVEQVPSGTHYDHPAKSGNATPDEILAGIRASMPDADPSFELTAVNQNIARIENGRAIFLARKLGDGQWYLTESNACWDFSR